MKLILTVQTHFHLSFIWFWSRIHRSLVCRETYQIAFWSRLLFKKFNFVVLFTSGSSVSAFFHFVFVAFYILFSGWKQNFFTFLSPSLVFVQFLFLAGNLKFSVPVGCFFRRRQLTRPHSFASVPTIPANTTTIRKVMIRITRTTCKTPFCSDSVLGTVSMKIRFDCFLLFRDNIFLRGWFVHICEPEIVFFVFSSRLKNFLLPFLA